jgi:hypothetical protein
MHKWQKKYQRDIEKRISGVNNVELARSMCEIIIWYGLRHPEVKTCIEEAKIALEYLKPDRGARHVIEKLSIDRGGQGFKMQLWFMGYGNTKHIHVTTKGLPPVPTTYETLNN